MLALLLLLLLLLFFFGFGFTTHILWVVAIVCLLAFIFTFFYRSGTRGRYW